MITADDNNSNVNINILLDELIMQRKYIAHTEKVSGIYFSELLGLIITTGDDNKIMIRKYYDLTLLTMINLNINLFCVDLKINHCFLYVLLYDDLIKKQTVQIYSVNGLKVGGGQHNYINTFNFDEIGNVFIGCCKENKIEVYNPSMTKKIDEISVNINSNANTNQNVNLNVNVNVNNQNAKRNSSELNLKKKKSSKILSVDKSMND